MNTAKPFLKWAGGKAQIIGNILDNFPNNISHYYEPFLGGGSVLLGLLERIERQEITVKRITVSDINWNLINCYKTIRKHHKALIDYLVNIKKQYDEAPMEKDKPVNCSSIEEAAEKGKQHIYYYIRNKYNQLERISENKVELAALFIFLNKTCFRGLYREGRNGFNVPFGNYETVSIDFNNLIQVHCLLKKYDVTFKVGQFDEVSDRIREKDFIYLDPPYYPEKETSFVSYHQDGFKREDHNRLIELCKSVKCRFLLSNSNTEYIKDSFNDYHVKELLCKRHINAKKPGATCYEVLVSNYCMQK